MIDVASAGSHRTNCTIGAAASVALGASSSARVVAATGGGTTGRTTVNVYVESPRVSTCATRLVPVFTLSTATMMSPARISEAAAAPPATTAATPLKSARSIPNPLSSGLTCTWSILSVLSRSRFAGTFASDASTSAFSQRTVTVCGPPTSRIDGRNGCPSIAATTYPASKRPPGADWMAPPSSTTMPVFARLSPRRTTKLRAPVIGSAAPLGADSIAAERG